MADYQARTTVSAPPDALFSYLSDVENLPGYFSRMKEAHRTSGDEVHTEAVMPDGQTVAGEAWFRVDDASNHISWGSEGENDYSGYLDVAPDGDGSSVQVHIYSPHVASDEVQQGVDATVAAIKQKVEHQGAGKP